MRNLWSLQLAKLFYLLLASCAWMAGDAATAAADIPMPHGYIEPCTLAFVEDGTKECELCTPSDDDARPCSERFEPRGYTKACQAGYHSAPAQVWCIPTEAARGSGFSKWLLLGAGCAAVLLIAFLRRAWPRVRASK
jgi:hypothetical protein